MIYKTYISKSNSIISGSKLNTGLNPIMELCYGKDTVVMRSLIYFDHNKIKEQMDSGNMPNIEKMKQQK